MKLTKHNKDKNDIKYFTRNDFCSGTFNVSGNNLAPEITMACPYEVHRSHDKTSKAFRLLHCYLTEVYSS